MVSAGSCAGRSLGLELSKGLADAEIFLSGLRLYRVTRGGHFEFYLVSESLESHVVISLSLSNVTSGEETSISEPLE